MTSSGRERGERRVEKGEEQLEVTIDSNRAIAREKEICTFQKFIYLH